MYKILLDDNSEFIGGIEFEKCDWENIPQNRKIVSIQYSFLGVNSTLIGFESYNHLVEYSYVLNGKNYNNKIGN